METSIEKLNNLYQAEASCNRRANELRGQQLELCKESIIGKCFRIDNPRCPKIDGEKYNKYVCITDIVFENKLENKFFLKAIVVAFDRIELCQDFGVSIGEQSDCISEWVQWLDCHSEEIPLEDFQQAAERAAILLGAEIEKQETDDSNENR